MSAVILVAAAMVGLLILIVAAFAVINLFAQRESLQAAMKARGWRIEGGVMSYTIFGEIDGMPVEIRKVIAHTNGSVSGHMASNGPTTWFVLELPTPPTSGLTVIQGHIPIVGSAPRALSDVLATLDGGDTEAGSTAWNGRLGTVTARPGSAERPWPANHTVLCTDEADPHALLSDEVVRLLDAQTFFSVRTDIVHEGNRLLILSSGPEGVSEVDRMVALARPLLPLCLDGADA